MKVELNAAARLTASTEVTATTREEAGKLFLALKKILGDKFHTSDNQHLKRKMNDGSQFILQEVEWDTFHYSVTLTLDVGDLLKVSFSSSPGDDDVEWVAGGRDATAEKVVREMKQEISNLQPDPCRHGLP